MKIANAMAREEQWKFAESISETGCAREQIIAEEHMHENRWREHVRR